MNKLILILSLIFIVGCSDDKEVILDKPPVQSDITSDIPIAKSEPNNKIDPELPPVPVAE